MAIISFGRIDKKLFLILAIIIKQLIELVINQKVPSKYSNAYLSIFPPELGTIIIGVILCFVFKNQTKKKQETKKSIKYIIYLILSRGLKTSFEYFYMEIVGDKKYKYDCLLDTVNGVEIVIITIGASLILKNKYYAHHKITMVIYCILGIICDIILGNFSIPNYSYIAIYIFFLINDCLVFCYIKYMIDKLYYSYIEILIYWGLIGLSVKLIYFAYLLIKEINNDKDSLLPKINKYLTKTNIFIVIFFQFFYKITINGIYYLLLFLVIYYLQPNHIVIIEEFAVFETSIFEDDNPNKYYTLIPFAFQFLALLFYFEILELNFWKLNKNTAKNIQAREENECEDDEDINKILNNKANIELADGQYLLDPNNLDENTEEEVLN